MPECLATFRGLDIVCGDQRIRAELDELPARNPILADVLADAILIAARLGWRLVITSVYRNRREDIAVGGTGRGVHTLWRAVDIRTRDVRARLVADLKRSLDERWVYDPMRIDPVTGESTYPLCYVKPHGTGPHFHLQVHPETVRRRA